MFNPAFHTVLVQTDVEERHRSARARTRGHVRGAPAAPMSTLMRRALDRVFAAGRAPAEEGEDFPGFELVGRSSAATLRPRS